MNTRVSIIVVALTISASCKDSCVDSKSEANGEKIVRTYPDCSDLTYYRRQFYYSNGQLGSDGYFRNGIEEGKFKSWATNGNQTASWEVLDGKEHGFIQCWYDNGNKKKETFLDREVRKGLEKTWFETGQPRSIGLYVDGKEQGLWLLSEMSGGWRLTVYNDGIESGHTIERQIDSLGKVTHVSGQYKNGKEDGFWKWFNGDSTLHLTATYSAGVLNGAFVEYNPDGSVNQKGVYVNGVFQREKAER